MQAAHTALTILDWWTLQSNFLFCKAFTLLSGPPSSPCTNETPDVLLSLLFGAVHTVAVLVVTQCVARYMENRYEQDGRPSIINYRSGTHLWAKVFGVVCSAALACGAAAAVSLPEVRAMLLALHTAAAATLGIDTVDVPSVLHLALKTELSGDMVTVLSLFVGVNVFFWTSFAAVATVTDWWRDVAQTWSRLVLFTYPLFFSDAVGPMKLFVLRVALAVLFTPLPSVPFYARYPNIGKLAKGAYKKKSWADATADCPKTGRKYLIVGVGFLGRKLVEYLALRGETELVCFDIMKEPLFVADLRQKYPALKLTYIQGDITQQKQIDAATVGIDIVYSTFALIRFWERLSFQADASYKVNVTGSENLVRACKANNIAYLIYTASSHVNADPTLQTDSLKESHPYITREKCTNHYGWTKALGEKAVLEAADSTLKTVSLRPAGGIFGCSDQNMVDVLTDTKTYRTLRPTVRMDWILVDNVVLSMFKGEARLLDGTPGISGEAFNVTNWQPLGVEECGEMFHSYVPDRRVFGQEKTPALVMWLLCAAFEFTTLVTAGRINFSSLAEHRLNVVSLAMYNTSGMNFACSNEKAKSVLGYAPCYTVEEGMQMSAENWESDLTNYRYRKFAKTPQ